MAQVDVTADPSTDDVATARPTLLLVGGHSELADRIRTDARTRGWDVTDDERCDPTVALAFAPPTDIHRFAGLEHTVVVVEGDVALWARSGALDAAGTVMATSELLRRQLDAGWALRLTVGDIALEDVDVGPLLPIVTHATAPRAGTIGVATSVRARHQSEQWGDTHLARGLMRSFRRRGYRAVELIRPDWESDRAVRCDVTIHLRGLHRRPAVEGQINILWVISHPERVELDECDQYDIIASASAKHASELGTALGRSVAYVPQATDADTFRPGRVRSDVATDVLYVGNNRWPPRRAPRWLLGEGRSFDLYGSAWEGLPEHAMLVANHVHNRDLPALYRSAGVVVADHHGTMRRDGFLANRLFDVLASGGVVVSDEVDGLRGVFGELVPTYATPADLIRVVDATMSDTRARFHRARAGRAFVVAAHTLDHRAESLLDLIAHHRASQDGDCDIGSRSDA